MQKHLGDVNICVFSVYFYFFILQMMIKKKR